MARRRKARTKAPSPPQTLGLGDRCPNCAESLSGLDGFCPSCGTVLQSGEEE